MKINRHLEVPWNGATADVAVAYWRSRGFSDLAIDDGLAVSGRRSSTLRSFFPQYYWWRENEGFFDIDWRKFRARIRMTPGDVYGVRVELKVFIPWENSVRWTKWGAAFWRLEIIELDHLLHGAAGFEDVWRRFEAIERHESRAWVWSKGFAGRRVSEEWEGELSDLELKFLGSGKGSAKQAIDTVGPPKALSGSTPVAQPNRRDVSSTTGDP